MSDLLVVAFPKEDKAEQARAKLLSMERKHLIEDAVVAVKRADGEIKLSQVAAAGELWGIRAAASGNPIPDLSGALTDFGVNDKFVRGVAAAIPRGGAALFVLVEKVAVDDILNRLKNLSGTVWRGSFDKSAVEAICAALATSGRDQGIA